MSCNVCKQLPNLTQHSRCHLALDFTLSEKSPRCFQLRTRLLRRFFCPLFHAFRLLQNRRKVCSFGLYTFSTEGISPEMSIESIASFECWRQTTPNVRSCHLICQSPMIFISWYLLARRSGSGSHIIQTVTNLWLKHVSICFNICFNGKTWVRTASKASTRRDNFWMAWHCDAWSLWSLWMWLASLSVISQSGGYGLE